MYRFSHDEDVQKEELKANPLLQRFAQSRKVLSADPYRPLYHFVSPESTLNDPNGLCFWNGRWHLFYQAYPPEDPRQHWGHAVSEDLIHWKDLPYAIYPHPEEKSYSGSTLVEDDRVIAMYHGTKLGNMIATSSDPLLLNWEKLDANPVIPIASSDGSPLPYRVYDPCIWKKDGRYYSLSGATLPGPGGRPVAASFLFVSDDLENWTYLHPFVEDDRFTLVGDDGACPYFWPIGDRHILLFFSHMSGGQYLLGDYDTARDKFIATDGGKFNFGAAHPAGVHAPSAAPDGDGGVIVIFNMNPSKPTGEWDQIMSLPRRLTLDDDGRLLIEPAGDFASLRYGHRKVSDVTLRANEEVVLDGIEGNSMEIQAEIDLEGTHTLELNVLRSSNGEEATRFIFSRESGFSEHRGGRHRHLSMVTLDTSRSSSLPDVRARAPEVAPVFLDRDETLKLHIFLDKSVVEIFVNGRQCLAARVYPGRDDSVGVSFRSQGQTSKLRVLNAWQMKSIYP